MKISGNKKEIEFLRACIKVARFHPECTKEAEILCRALQVIIVNGEGDLSDIAQRLLANDRERGDLSP